MNRLLGICMGASLLACTEGYAVEQVHKALMRDHVYVSDQEQYGVNDKWVKSLRGDCEDFALVSYFTLLEKNYKPELWLVRTKDGEMHVTIVVNGNVFDNRLLAPINKSGYKFIIQMDDAAIRKL